MTLFYTSVSIVCAAVLGLGVGGYVGFRFAYWLLQRSFETMMKSEAYRTPLVLAWAYTQVRNRIYDGATVEELAAFLDQEGARIEEVAGDLAETELVPKLLAEVEERRRSRESGEK